MQSSGAEGRMMGFLCRGRWWCVAAILFVLLSFALFRWGPFAQLNAWEGGPLVWDMAADYSHGEAVSAWHTYGEAGRRVYARHLVLDSAFAVSQGVLLAWLIGYAGVVTNGGRLGTRWRWLLAIPAALLLLELVENAAVAAMLVQGPGWPEALTRSAATVTRWKLALLPLIPLVMLLSVGRLAARRLVGAPRASRPAEHQALRR